MDFGSAYRSIEKYMAQSLHIGVCGFSTNLPFLVGGFKPSEKYARQIGSFS